LSPTLQAVDTAIKRMKNTRRAFDLTILGIDIYVVTFTPCGTCQFMNNGKMMVETTRDGISTPPHKSLTLYFQRNTMKFKTTYERNL